jgi:hypothetical protein
LQMGVPVVAKLGHSLPSRAAGSILAALGLPDWVADSDEAYVESQRAVGRRSASSISCAANCPDRSGLPPPVTPSYTRKRWTMPIARCGNAIATTAADLRFAYAFNSTVLNSAGRITSSSSTSSE